MSDAAVPVILWPAPASMRGSRQSFSRLAVCLDTARATAIRECGEGAAPRVIANCVWRMLPPPYRQGRNAVILSSVIGVIVGAWPDVY